MIAEPMKTLELRYLIIEILIMRDMLDKSCFVELRL